MKTFLLYGSDACEVYESEGINGLLSIDYNKSSDSLFGDIDIFDTENIDILNTLTNFSGWGDAVEITEDEYDSLFEHWYK
jgi:hypothetical protein